MNSWCLKVMAIKIFVYGIAPHDERKTRRMSLVKNNMSEWTRSKYEGG